VPRPCKYQSLFLARTCAGCSAQVPEGQTHCQADKGYGRICGEKLAGCWAHEKNHTCIYVHPDEPWWSDALSGNLCYDRPKEFINGKRNPQHSHEVEQKQGKKTITTVVVLPWSPALFYKKGQVMPSAPKVVATPSAPMPTRNFGGLSGDKRQRGW